MEQQVKHDFLVDAYEFCQNDVVERASKLQQILVKLAKIDPAEAIRRWELLVQTKADEIWQDPVLTVDLIEELEYEVGDSWMMKAVANSSLLTEFLFGKARQIDPWLTIKIGNDNRQFEQVASHLQFVLKNPHKELTFDEFFEEVYENLFWEEERLSLLYPFVMRLENQELKNRVLEDLLEQL